MCFGRQYEGYSVPENGYNSELENVNCLAPYFTDLVVRDSDVGKVYYQVYDVLGEQNQHADEVSAVVKRLISDRYNISLHPVYILKATWVEVQQYGSMSEEVSS